MDSIYLNGMAFYGYHGVYSEENKLGQRYTVDLILKTSLQRAALNDDLNETIDYGQVYKTTKQIVEGAPKKLVEAVAETIASTVLNQFSTVEEITVKVTKPDPPIPGHYDSVAVEITRRQS